jgi:uracil phosphoribosyltransferase
MLNLLKHPLLTHKLTLLRRKETGTKDFREALEEIACLMAFEITRDLPVRDITVQTPMGSCTTQELAKDVVLIPVLRAGLGMVNGILECTAITRRSNPTLITVNSLITFLKQ